MKTESKRIMLPKGLYKESQAMITPRKEIKQKQYGVFKSKKAETLRKYPDEVILEMRWLKEFAGWARGDIAEFYRIDPKVLTNILAYSVYGWVAPFADSFPSNHSPKMKDSYCRQEYEKPLSNKNSFRGRVLNVLKQYGESTSCFIAEELRTTRDRVSRTLGEVSNKGIVIAKKEKGSLATYKLNPTVKVDLRTEKSRKVEAQRTIDNIQKANPLFTCWH